VVAVGVVVPARDAERFLRATLESIEQQSLVLWECVVVDDGSTDDTAAIAAEFAARDGRFRLVRTEPGGPCAARNVGMGELLDRSDYLTFMDADDLWTPDALERLVAAAQAGDGAIGAHGLAEFVDEAGAPLTPGVFPALGRARLGCRGGWPRRVDPAQPTRFEHVVTQSILFPPGVMVARASAYRAVGPFDERMRYAEDWDITIRLTRVGDLAFLDDVVLGYRRHGANLGASSGVPKAASAVRRKAYYSADNSPDEQRIVRDAWRAAQVIDARSRLGRARALAAEHRFADAVAQIGRLPFLAARYARGAPPRPSI
jgi:glycosyltransferase involved in cell wall biosynthesis